MFLYCTCVAHTHTHKKHMCICKVIYYVASYGSMVFVYTQAHVQYWCMKS